MYCIKILFKSLSNCDPTWILETPHIIFLIFSLTPLFITSLSKITRDNLCGTKLVLICQPEGFNDLLLVSLLFASK